MITFDMVIVEYATCVLTISAVADLAFTIRPARLADADSLFGLLVAFATSYQPDRTLFDRHLPQLIESREADLLVADHEPRLVGYALAFDLLTLFANGLVSDLQELMVAEASRGQGIGRRLVEAIADRARARGAVELTVPTRRAADFYVHLGFTETARYFKRPLR